MENKLGRTLKFGSRLEDHHLNSEALWASLSGFRSKVSGFVNQILSKRENPGRKFLSLTGFKECFEMIDVGNRAFAKLVVEIDYPMSQWGGRATEEYLNYTLSLLDQLNSINSFVSHLSQAKISISHALNLIRNSQTAKSLKNISGRSTGKDLRFEGSVTMGERPVCEKELVVLQALMVSKKIALLALGLVLSGCSGDAKPYMEVRKFGGGFDDPLITVLEARFCHEVTEIQQGTMEEVEEVNRAMERLRVAISPGRYNEAVEKLKTRLETLENSIQGIQKQANKLFSEVLATRNKLLDNIRLTG
ncbi:uncharacterized protein LOC105164219 [Sesamum indicum]|uniref:Uncharacterized protein LOC105164219 n=1 Tax=Sesamum indicum TaxID=4182 RepID=A0A6I9TC13_SESIN|nr:uncharacterized protein LOC105164219 [Sesamum indicum]